MCFLDLKFAPRPIQEWANFRSSTLASGADERRELLIFLERASLAPAPAAQFRAARAAGVRALILKNHYEPTSALDPTMVSEVLAVIRRLVEVLAVAGDRVSFRSGEVTMEANINDFDRAYCLSFL